MRLYLKSIAWVGGVGCTFAFSISTNLWMGRLKTFDLDFG